MSGWKGIPSQAKYLKMLVGSCRFELRKTLRPYIFQAFCSNECNRTPNYLTLTVSLALETSFSTTLMHHHDPTVRCQLVGEHSDKMFGQFEPWLTSLRFSLGLPAHILEKVLEEARSCFRSSYVCQCAMT